MVKCRKMLFLPLFILSVMLCFCMVAFADETDSFDEEGQEEEAVPVSMEGLPVTISYETHIQLSGWLEAVENGEFSGTVDKERRMEAIRIQVVDETIEGGITYRTYVDGLGWTDWTGGGTISGTEGQDRAIKALELKLTGALADTYDIYYRLRMENFGFLDWAVNGVTAGTLDLPLRSEGIEIMVLPKGFSAPGATEFPLRAQYEYRRDADGQSYLYKQYGDKVNGWFSWDGSRRYGDNGILKTGWNYIDGFKLYFTEDGRLVQDVDAIIGKQSSYLIKVNKQANCVTIYAQDGKNGYIIPVKAMVATTGADTPIGTFKTPEKYRWRLMVDDSYSQYATRIIAGQGFLLHSITYEEPDIYKMNTHIYNHLGNPGSKGCVRLTTGDAKWIYDNCKIGTTVTIYNDATPGPFDKPVITPVPGTQRWDPTDPLVTAR